MHRLISLVVSLWISLLAVNGQVMAPVDPNALVQKIKGELSGPRLPKSSQNLGDMSCCR
jgi:hypothetical protein